MLTWVDLLALFSLALGLALGFRGGVVMGFMGAGLALYVLLAQLGLSGWGVALALGLGAGLLGKSLPLPRLSRGLEALLGTLGGFLLGLFLALSLWTGYPWERTGAGTLRYPAATLPTPIYQGVAQSPFAREAFRLAWSTPWLRKALALEGQHPGKGK
ncbi:MULTISPECIES: sodium/proton-translocating pyrophosphatase [Thermus]|uniref:sodium/proton-translocating pyrophosphatase n=1 Tax=Thermus TaxID=270 RepID=UPI001F48323F|nr:MULTISPECIES: sodium/proton-translocating pyrophosphatase [Thermus]